MEDHFKATRTALHLLGGVFQRRPRPGGRPEVKGLLRGAFTNLALATEGSSSRIFVEELKNPRGT